MYLKESDNQAVQSRMKRRGFLWIAGMGALTGCGGGSNDSGFQPADGRVQAIPYVADDLGDEYGDSVARVEVRWEAPGGIRPSDIIGYYIYRDGVIVSMQPRNQSTWVDLLPPVKFQAGETLPAPWTFAISEPSYSNLGTLVVRSVRSPWLTAGTTHEYEVHVLYRQFTTTPPTSEFNRITLIVSKLATTPVQATPTTRPSILTVGGTTTLKSISLTYQTVTGADEYLVQLAADASFTSPVQHGPITQEHTPTPVSVPTFDASRLINIAPGSTLYVRIGARRVQDTNRPKDGYIWSAPKTLIVAATP